MMPPMRSLLLLAALATTACGGGAPAPAPAAPAAPALTPAQKRLAADLDAAVRRAIDGKPMAGLSVAVVVDGTPVLARGYGMADLEGKRPAAADTIYRIGSITKTFTAALILKLAEAGKVALDDPITRYLPDYDTKGATITLRHLLQHTSGIVGYTELEAFWPRSSLPFPRSQLVDLFESQPLQFQPGERWAYSNSGYYLLGLIVEKVTGVSYAEALAEHLFGPAGLRDTSYCTDDMNGPRQAHPYEIEDGKPVFARPIVMSHPFAAGALCSTVIDLARWMAALSGQTIITQPQWAQMSARAKLTGGATMPYGMGLQIGDLDGHRKYGHNGGINGFHSKLEIFPDDRLVIAVLANTGGGLVDEVADKLARAAMHLPEPKILDLPLTEEQAAPYQGRFEFADVPVKLEFRYQDGRLHVANVPADGSPPTFRPLRYQGNHVFLAPEVRARLTFTVDGGKATGLQAEQGGLTLQARPMP